MKTFDIEITKIIKLAEEDLSDILCSCFEGGCNYWCCIDNTTDEWINAKEKLYVNGNPWPTTDEIMLYMLTHDMPIKLIDEEDDVVLYMTMNTFMGGIKMAIENGHWSGDYIDDVDGEVGDAIIQYAVFGELVYG